MFSAPLDLECLHALCATARTLNDSTVFTKTLCRNNLYLQNQPVVTFSHNFSSDSSVWLKVQSHFLSFTFIRQWENCL